MLRRFSLVLILIVACGVAHAADKPRMGAIEDWVLPPLAAGAPARGVSGAALAMLTEDAQLRFDGKGTSRFSEFQVKVQTAEGLAALGTITAAWSPATDVLTFNRVNIIRDGVVIDCLPKDGVFNIIRREAKLESDATLDGILTAVVRPEGLRVGDILDVAMTLRRDDPLLVGAFDDRVQGFDALPLARLRIRATWPDQSATRWRTSNAFGPFKVTRAQGATTIGIEVSDLEPLVSPQDAPARFQHGRTLDVSNYAQWSDVSAKLQPLYVAAARIQPGGALADEVKALAAKTADPAARALAAFILVEDKVRYFEQAIGDGGLKPAPADLTWSRRWGDCKAKTVLLVAMLQMLGVQAEPVYVSVAHGDGLSERLPSLAVFDHVVVRATIGGRELWLDGTRVGDTSLAALRTPTFGWVLPIRGKGAALIQVRAAPFDQPQEISKLDLDASEGLTLPAKAHGELIARGDSAKVLHSAIGNLAPAALDNALRTYWVKRYDFVTPKTMTARFDETTGEETLVFDGAAKLDWSGGYEADGASLGWKFNAHRDPGPDADAPFALVYPTYESTEQTIVLPHGGQGFSFTGDNVDEDLAGFHFHRSAEIKGGAFHLETSTRSLVPEISAADALKSAEPVTALSKTTIHVQSPDDYVWTQAELAAALATEPTNADGYYTRANALFDAGRRWEALSDLDKAVAMGKPTVNILALRGLDNVGLDLDKAATADLDRAEALDPKQMVMLRARGLMAERHRLYPTAVEYYNKVLVIDAKDTFSLEHLARVYFEMKDYPAALATSDRLSDAEGNDRHFARAALLIQMKDVSNARAELALIKLEGRDEIERRFTRIGLSAAVGDQEGAEQGATDEVARAPSARAYLAHAANRAAVDLDGREADDMAALKLEPKNLEAKIQLALVEAQRHDYAKSDAWLDQALAIRPNDVALIVLKAENALHGGRSPGAVAQLYQQVRQLAADNGDELNSLCWSQATHDFMLETALRDCDAAIELTPGRAPILDSRGFVLLRLGRDRDAIKAYDEAIAIAPLAESLFGRSVAEAGAGDVDAAKRDRAEAVARFPKVEAQFAEEGGLNRPIQAH
jgi:tetratricopeptide (TPR) repeat protein